MSKQFGDRLKELRMEKGLTQEELAKIFNTGKASISHYESNRRIPDANTIVKYATFFNVTVDYILGKSDIRNPYYKSECANDKIDLSEFPEEIIQQIKDYVEFLKEKYKNQE